MVSGTQNYQALHSDLSPTRVPQVPQNLQISPRPPKLVVNFTVQYLKLSGKGSFVLPLVHVIPDEYLGRPKSCYASSSGWEGNVIEVITGALNHSG